uniref:Uncharacterized protein n=2 Tax=unclassified Caudoviricetes TaxID=2788787 RepID=A0A8S5SGX4_9CAUD|nr:MAG TPA: hypothetical protein [Myoviridae sp. ctHMa1]DAF86543.1 MAG TPA: hypothetical protein [Myoviridae sp. ctaUM17]DAV96344.1 MAG TPA: hypothetical protein [Caudoviricetes sp.]DAX95205.1 MAG TPA: hypothetical protein [Caudoviricetes sp.]DAY76331.1 MAG TPA: hypothetical protein [Caudoviricetes sp.]
MWLLTPGGTTARPFSINFRTTTKMFPVILHRRRLKHRYIRPYGFW